MEIIIGIFSDIDILNWDCLNLVSQVVYCTTPGGTIHIDYKANATPLEVMQCCFSALNIQYIFFLAREQIHVVRFFFFLTPMFVGILPTASFRILFREEFSSDSFPSLD